MSKPKLKPTPINSQGFVAIVVSIIFTVIISGITISFALIMSRESRQALDNQLSTQAFYAAESGINYMVASGNFNSKPTCDASAAPINAASGSISPTCLLINSQPDDAGYDPEVDTPLFSTVNTAVDAITVQWQAYDGSTNFDSSGNTLFTPSSSWGKTGVVEVSIFPIRDPIVTSTLAGEARTFYLYPSTGSEGINYQTEDGKIGKGGCTSSPAPGDLHCKVTIANVPTAGVSRYVIKLRSIYSKTKVSLTGQVAGVTAFLNTGQVVLDATGKSGDVLRRVQVRYTPNVEKFDMPAHAIETATDLCKQLDVWPGGADAHGC